MGETGWLRATLATLVAAGTLLAEAASGQEPATAVLDVDPCIGCDIVFEELVRFGSDDDGGMITSRWMTPFRLRGDRWGSADAGDEGAIRIYDEDGRFLDRIDAAGRGPGEFTAVSAFFQVDDGYLLYDRGQGRMSRFGLAFEFVESWALNMTALRLAVMPDGRLLINGVTPATAVRGELMHIVDVPTGERVSFGGEEGSVDLRPGSTALHRVFDYHEGRVWVAKLDRYTIDVFDVSGVHLETLVREAAWFPPASAQPNVGDFRRRPPAPKVQSVFVDSASLVWVMSHVADAGWEDAVGRVGARGDIPNENDYLDTVIEVLDPSARRVLATVRLDRLLREVNQSETMETSPIYYHIEEKSDGRIEVIVERVRMESR